MLATLVSAVQDPIFEKRGVDAPKPSYSYESEETSKYIVEFKNEPLLKSSAKQTNGVRVSSAKMASVLNEHEQFMADIFSSGRKALSKSISSGSSGSSIKEFKNTFNGLAVELTDSQLKQAKGLSYVKKVYRDQKVKVALDESLDIINAPSVWVLQDANGTNITGAGIKIAIIDTGIDYTHPDLGGCFGAGCKVVGGYDIYNDDNDPFDDHGHGTHVAGIAAGGGELNFQYDQSILMEFNAINDEYIKVIALITDGEASFPLLYGDGTQFTRAGDDQDNLVTSSTNSIVLNETNNDEYFVASWNSGTESESYSFRLQDIDDDRIEIKNAVTGGTYFMLKGGIASIGRVALRLDYANNTDGTAQLSLISSDSSFNKLFDAKGNWIDLPELDKLPADRYHMNIFNSSNDFVEGHEFYWSGYELKYYPPGNDEPVVSGIKGVAPDATLYAYKVLSAGGYGSWSDVILGIEYAVDPNQDGDFSDKVDVASMSLGGMGNPDDPISLAVDTAVEAGVVFTISAGNSGPWESSIGSPGTARKAITVGATDKQDEIAYFSSRGPTSIGTVKPDVVAPGVSIYSSVPNGACSLCDASGYMPLSGTSMSAPHVAGAAALIKQAHPGWTPEEIKYALRNTAVDLGYDINTQGYGRIDVLSAVGLSNPPPIAVLNTSGNLDRSVITITGSAISANFNYYTIEFSPKDEISWSTDKITLANGGLSQVNNGVLGTIDLTSLGMGKYLLRLKVYSSDGISEDNSVIRIIYPDSYEPDDSYDLANPIDVGNETQVHTQFPAMDNDFVKFDAVVSDLYFISADRRSVDFYPMIEIYDTDGTTLIHEINYYKGYWAPGADGTYYINILDFYGKYYGEEYIGTYDLSVNSTTMVADAYEPDNSPAEASWLEEYDTQLHNFYPAGDADYIKFNATAGDYFTIRTNDAGEVPSEPQVELYDSDGTTLLRGADWLWYSNYITWSPSVNGTYYAKVTDDYDLIGGEYNIYLVTERDPTNLDIYEPDSDYTQAKQLATDGTVQSRTTSPQGDVDYIKFDAVVGKYYEIKTSNLVDSDTFMFLFDSDGTTLIIYNDDYYGEDLSSRILWSPTVDGTYYVQVREYWEYSDGGSYDISINSGIATLDLDAGYMYLVGGLPTVNETGIIEFSIENEGTASSSGAVASLYEFDDGIDDYVLLESKVLGTILPQSWTYTLFNWTPTRTGEYSLKATIYDANDVDHNNDDSYGGYFIRESGPDVEVGYIKINGPSVVNQTVTIESDIGNEGNEKATNIDVEFYDIYEPEGEWFDYGVDESFSYNGVDYQIRAEAIDSYSANVSISYESTVEEFIANRYEVITLSNGLLVSLEIYPFDDYGLLYGTGSKYTTSIPELNPDEVITASFDWVPDAIGDRLLMINAYAENDTYLGNNGEARWASVFASGPNLDIWSYVEDSIKEMTLTEGEILSEKVGNFDEYKKKGLGNKTVSVYSVTINQTYNVSIEVDNYGDKTADNVSIEAFIMHDVEYFWAPFDTTNFLTYNGTDYQILPIMIDENRVQVNISYDSVNGVFEVIGGQAVLLGNGVIFDLSSFSKTYDGAYYKLGQQSFHWSENVSSIGVSTEYNTRFEWTPDRTGDHILSIFADTVGESYYNDNSDYDYLTVGGFGIDIMVDYISVSYPIIVNQTNSVWVDIRNIGSENASDINVNVYDDTYGTLLYSDVINLSIDYEKYFSFNWVPTNTGWHDLRAVADVAGEVTPENNVRLVNVYIEEDIVEEEEEEDYWEIIRIKVEEMVNASFFNAEFSEFDICVSVPYEWNLYQYKVSKDATGIETTGGADCWDDTQFEFTVSFLNATNFMNLYDNPSADNFMDRHAIDYYLLPSIYFKSDGIQCNANFQAKYCGYLNTQLSNAELLLGGMACCISYDPPQITSYSPTETNLRTTNDGQISFSITATDNVGNITISWYVNDGFVGNGNNYDFTASSADDYTVRAVASNIESNATQSWSVTAYGHPLAETFNGDTTNFSVMSEGELANAYNVVLEKTDYGKIEFSSTLDLRDIIDLDSCVAIAQNVAGIDNNCVPELNMPATISLYHVSYDQDPKIYYNSGFTTDPNSINTLCNFCTITDYTPYPTTDGTITFSVSHFSVFSSSGTNNVPRADAGPDQSIDQGTIVTLDGSGSYDPDADTLTYSWTQVSGLNVNLSSPSAVSTTFNATDIGQYVFQLIVNDGLLSNSDTVTIRAGDKLVIKEVDVKIDGKTKRVTEGEKIRREAKPGSSVEFKVEVENTFLESIEIEDIEVEVIIRGIDDDDDLEEESKEFDLRNGRDKNVELSFDIPLIVDEGTYKVEINVDGEDENGRTHEVQFTAYLEVEKEDHEVVISEMKLIPSSTRCGQTPRLDIEIVNIGSKDEDDIGIEIESVELGINIEEEDIELEEGVDSDSIYDRSFRLDIDDVVSGSYPITATVYLDNEEEISETVNLGIVSCETTSTTEEPVNVETVVLNTLPNSLPPQIIIPQQPAVKISFKDTSEYMMLLAIATTLVLGLVIYAAGAVIILSKKGRL